MDAIQEFHVLYPCERPFFIASDDYWKEITASLSNVQNVRAKVESGLRETLPTLPSNPIGYLESVGGDIVMSCCIIMFTIQSQKKLAGADIGKEYVNWPRLRHSSFERPTALFPFKGPAWELCTVYHDGWKNGISDKVRAMMAANNWTPQSAHAALKLGVDIKYMYFFHLALFSFFDILVERIDEIEGGVDEYEDDNDDHEEDDEYGC